MTFMAAKPKMFEGGFRLSTLFKAVGERFTSMAPRAKKTTSSKRHSKHEEPVSAPIVPSVAPAASPAPAPAAAPAAPASPVVPDDSVLAQLSPAIEAHKELEAEAAMPASNDGLSSIAPPTNDQLYAEQLTGQHRAAANEVDEGDLYHSQGADIGSRPRDRRSRTGMLVLTVAMLVLAAAAIAGVTMFLKKNDMMDGLLARFSRDEEPAAPGGEQAVVPTAPESVAVTFRLAVAKPAVDVGDTPTLVGRALETEVSADDSFAASGSKPSVGGKAKGSVTIVNTSSTPYTFVATTRVLSKDGVLFRLDAATPIPANGSVKAAVTADAAGPAGDIGPSEFTIPGLGPSLATVVYATSDAAMSGGAGGDVPAVSVDDLVQAKEALHEKAIMEAMADFDALRHTSEYIDPALYAETEVAFDAPEAGTAQAAFDAELTLGVKVMTIPEEEVGRLLDEEKARSVADAAGYELGSRIYRVVAYDTATGVAEVRVEAPLRSATQE
jgi:hypothetical protein